MLKKTVTGLFSFTEISKVHIIVDKKPIGPSKYIIAVAFLLSEILLELVRSPGGQRSLLPEVEATLLLFFCSQWDIFYNEM